MKKYNIAYMDTKGNIAYLDRAGNSIDTLSAYVQADKQVQEILAKSKGGEYFIFIDSDDAYDEIVSQLLNYQRCEELGMGYQLIRSDKSYVKVLPFRWMRTIRDYIGYRR